MFTDQQIGQAVKVTTNNGKEPAYAFRVLSWLNDHYGYVVAGDLQIVIDYLNKNRIDHIPVRKYYTKDY